MVNFEIGRAKPHKRRAISTIVGGAIFLVLFTSALSTFFIAMDFQRDSINTQRSISESMMEKTKEKFAISASTDPVDRLGIQVKNQGTNPVEIATVWIVTKSGSFPANQYDIDYLDSNIPPGYGADILENTPVVLLPDDYDIKVVSVLGTIEKAKLTVGGANNLRAKLIAIPPDVKVGQNVTLTMHVENIGASTLLNVVPFNDVSMDNYPDINLPFTSPVPPPAKPIDLDPGEGTFFTWEYVTTGSPNAEIIFEGYATSTEEDTGFIKDSNFAREKIRLQEPDDSEIIVLTEDLLSRPEIFMVIPGPFGIDNQEGLWGVNIVNPTPIPFEVNKLTISAIIPRSQSQDRIFDTNNCSPNTIAPTPANWNCPSDNQLMWEGPPLTIDPYSVFPFLAKMTPGSLGGSTDDLEAVLVQATVYTTLGQFGKSGYGSSVKNDNSYANVAVYLTDNPGSTASANIQSTRIGIGSGDTITLAASLADFDIGSTNYIDAGSRLIINVPKGWTVDAPSIDTFGNFNCIAPCPQIYSDTSSQIIGELIGDLDGVGGVARTIEFDVTAPIVTNEQMYVMYVLAEGTTKLGDYAIGPLAEIVLQVIP